ncbi:cuticle protein 16.8 [Nephila pilipes]|uniref:Cuticle protein 16.8 n=1 Tax=Nephila pilipes TaxID=299642 RepID=A0A8X6NPL9_NEPPI|nr:cuticle protein 16.8 [Nephila pilipes]
MIKALLFTVLVGLVAAQYGHGGSGGYGPDGVRNRYFILGHGRGPISTTVGSGIYGTSLGGHGGYGLGGHGGYGLGGHGGYGLGGSGRSGHRSGHSAGAYGGSSYAAPAPVYVAPAPVHAPAPVYAPAPVHAPAPVYAPAPAAHSYAPAPRAYAPAHAPAVRSYSAPAIGHSLYGASAHGAYSAPAPSYGGHHDDLAQPTPYDFGYNVHNEHGDQLNRQESGDGHGNVHGSYGYRDAYGIFRHVDYVADHHGFRANQFVKICSEGLFRWVKSFNLFVYREAFTYKPLTTCMFLQSFALIAMKNKCLFYRDM